MKNIKLLVMLCLIFTLAVTAVACGEATTTTAETTTEAKTENTIPATTTTAVITTAKLTTTAPVTTAPITTEKQTFSSLKIGDTPLSEYKIVYAKSEYAGYTKLPTMKAYFPVYDFDRETADRLSNLIFQLSGIRLSVTEDQGNAEVANEILIGNTNRTEAVKALRLGSLASDDYVIDVEGSKLVICGGEYGTTWHALDYLETFFAQLLDEDKTEYAFASDYTYKGNYHLTRIGCIGDSITSGNNASNARLTYPEQMGRYLWKDALVTNLGSSGASMRNDLHPYTQRDVYQTALNVAAEIDIFVVMLGTNDSYYDQTWTNASSQKFNADCLSIFKSLWDKNQNLRFVLANCPKYFGNGGWASETVRQLQKDLVPTLNDVGYPTTFFDTYAATSEMGSYFKDQLHPNNEGYMLMGEIFANLLKPMIDAMQK